MRLASKKRRTRCNTAVQSFQRRSSSTGPARLSMELEIRQLVSTWMAATKVGDVETVLSLISDDVVFLVPGQPIMRKTDFAAAARAQSGPAGPKFGGTREIQEIKILGDWAFM